MRPPKLRVQAMQRGSRIYTTQQKGLIKFMKHVTSSCDVMHTAFEKQQELFPFPIQLLLICNKMV